MIGWGQEILQWRHQVLRKKFKGNFFVFSFKKLGENPHLLEPLIDLLALVIGKW